MEWSEGGKWNHCNSIINKYILKKRKKEDLPVENGETKDEKSPASDEAGKKEANSD